MTARVRNGLATSVRTCATRKSTNYFARAADAALSQRRQTNSQRTSATKAPAVLDKENSSNISRGRRITPWTKARTYLLYCCHMHMPHVSRTSRETTPPPHPPKKTHSSETHTRHWRALHHMLRLLVELLAKLHHVDAQRPKRLSDCRPRLCCARGHPHPHCPHERHLSTLVRPSYLFSLTQRQNRVPSLCATPRAPPKLSFWPPLLASLPGLAKGVRTSSR